MSGGDVVVGEWGEVMDVKNRVSVVGGELGDKRWGGTRAMFPSIFRSLGR